jgi:hypothetical protein
MHQILGPFWRPRKARAFVAALGLIAGLAGAAKADDVKVNAGALVQSASSSVQNFLTNPQWQAVRNLLGGARAIIIMPHDVRADFS